MPLLIDSQARGEDNASQDHLIGRPKTRARPMGIYLTILAELMFAIFRADPPRTAPSVRARPNL